MPFIGPEWSSDKLHLLADLDYCRYAVHGDKLAGDLLHYMYQCRGDVSRSFHGHGYVCRSRAQMAAGAGITLKQFDKRAWPRLRCYPYIAAETWQEAHDSIRRSVWFALTPYLLPDPPAGAVDWRALKQAAPWRHLTLKPSKPKAPALPVPASPIAPEPVTPTTTPSTATPLPAVPTATKRRRKKSPPSWSTVGLKSGAFLPVDATIMHDGSPYSPEPRDDAAPRKRRPMSAENRQKARDRYWYAWRASFALDFLDQGKLDFLTVVHVMEELFLMLRDPIPTRDLWLFNEWTYEDDTANEAWMFEVDPDDMTEEWVKTNRAKFHAPEYMYERGFERRPGTPYVKLPKVKIPTAATSKYTPPPSRHTLLRRFREAVIKAGYRNKFLVSKNGENLIG